VVIFFLFAHNDTATPWQPRSRARALHSASSTLFGQVTPPAGEVGGQRHRIHTDVVS
jgi:hypothetical protein